MYFEEKTLVYGDISRKSLYTIFLPREDPDITRFYPSPVERREYVK